MIGTAGGSATLLSSSGSSSDSTRSFISSFVKNPRGLRVSESSSFVTASSSLGTSFSEEQPNSLKSLSLGPDSASGSFRCACSFNRFSSNSRKAFSKVSLLLIRSSRGSIPLTFSGPFFSSKASEIRGDKELSSCMLSSSSSWSSLLLVQLDFRCRKLPLTNKESCSCTTVSKAFTACSKIDVTALCSRHLFRWSSTSSSMMGSRVSNRDLSAFNVSSEAASGKLEVSGSVSSPSICPFILSTASMSLSSIFS